MRKQQSCTFTKVLVWKDVSNIIEYFDMGVWKYSGYWIILSNFVFLFHDHSSSIQDPCDFPKQPPLYLTTSSSTSNDCPPAVEKLYCVRASCRWPPCNPFAALCDFNWVFWQRYCICIRHRLWSPPLHPLKAEQQSSQRLASYCWFLV